MARCVGRAHVTVSDMTDEVGVVQQGEQKVGVVRCKEPQGQSRSFDHGCWPSSAAACRSARACSYEIRTSRPFMRSNVESAGFDHEVSMKTLRFSRAVL